MSFRGRRYADRRIIAKLIYDSDFREKQNKKVVLIDYEMGKFHLNILIDEYTDYAILCLINMLNKNYISRKYCLKLIDKIEGYYFAYVEKMLDEEQLYYKITDEIMKEEFGQTDWHYIGIFNDIYK